MAAPELKWPRMPFTPMSASLLATTIACLGSAWSSSDCSTNLIFLPPISRFCRLRSSTASRAPLSLSLPQWAAPPVSGPAWPISTVCSDWAQAGSARAPARTPVSKQAEAAAWRRGDMREAVIESLLVFVRAGRAGGPNAE